MYTMFSCPIFPCPKISYTREYAYTNNNLTNNNLTNKKIKKMDRIPNYFEHSQKKKVNQIVNRYLLQNTSYMAPGASVRRFKCL